MSLEWYLLHEKRPELAASRAERGVGYMLEGISSSFRAHRLN